MIYNKPLVDTCKKYNVDLGIQNVFTPIEKIEEATGFSFINAVPKDSKEICILFNVEFFEYFIKQDYIKNNEIKVVFGYDCDFDNGLAERCATVYEFKNYELINLTKFSKTKDVKEPQRAMEHRKFDVVFSNPPYNKNIDLKILQELFNHSNKIVFVHPVGFLIDKKFKRALYNNLRNTNYLEEVILFWGNKIFDINNFMPIGVTVWNTKKVENTCKVIDNALTYSKYICNINNISVHGDNNLVNNFVKNIKRYLLNFNGSLIDNFTLPNNLTDISYEFPLIVGHASKIDRIEIGFFSMTCKDTNYGKCDHTFRFGPTAASNPHWSFNNNEERENFIQYCKSKVARFCLSLLKNSQHIDGGELALIPWMDFTRSWNDKDLCKEFNISEELWQYIDKFIPDYYDDYKSGF